MSVRSRSALAAAMPAVTAAMVPKCPLCVIAIASAFGIELPLIAPALLPLLVLFLSISVALIVRTARRNARPVAAQVAVVCASAVILQRVLALAPAVSHAAVALLVITAFAASRRRCDERCEGCSTRGSTA